jgi:hypothetical protein
VEEEPVEEEPVEEEPVEEEPVEEEPVEEEPVEEEPVEEEPVEAKVSVEEEKNLVKAIAIVVCPHTRTTVKTGWLFTKTDDEVPNWPNDGRCKGPKITEIGAGACSSFIYRCHNDGEGMHTCCEHHLIKAGEWWRQLSPGDKKEINNLKILFKLSGGGETFNDAGEWGTWKTRFNAAIAAIS